MDLLSSSSFLFSSSPTSSLFPPPSPPTPTLAKHFLRAMLRAGARDTGMNPVQPPPSRSSQAQGPADKGKKKKPTKNCGR